MQYHAAKLIDNSVPKTIPIWLFSYIPSYLPLASRYVLLRWEGGGGVGSLERPIPRPCPNSPVRSKYLHVLFPQLTTRSSRDEYQGLSCALMRKILFLLRRVKDKRPSPSLYPLSYMLFMKLSVHILTNPGSVYCITERAAYE